MTMGAQLDPVLDHVPTLDKAKVTALTLRLGRITVKLRRLKALPLNKLV
jgi:hypothetical protein